MPHSQELFNNSYPERSQPNSSQVYVKVVGGVCVKKNKSFLRKFNFSFIQKIGHLLLHTLTILEMFLSGLELERAHPTP